MAAVGAAAVLAMAGGHASAAAPEIHTEDIARFYRLYEATDGRPTAAQLQQDYLDPGSEGLQTLARLRNVTGETIAKNLAAHPEVYSNAKRCMAVLPRVRQRLAGALGKLLELYPQARTPPVTIAVGRGKPVGVGGPADGVQIGLEALCATDYLNPDVEERFVHVIAHEYVHVQQAMDIDDGATVLEASLNEGGAEFVAELISGDVAYAGLQASTEGREAEIERAFLADIDKTDRSDWLDNGTPDKPGDLGYWVGYRIAKAYYQHAADKRSAVRDILEMTDAHAFLARSGWRPGVELR